MNPVKSSKMMLSMSALMGLFLIVNVAFTQETPTPNAGEPAKAAEPATTPAAPAAAATPAPPKIDKGDTAWMLTSAALVLMMTIPGLFLFYGGLVRGKNALGTIMQSFIIVGLITIQWALFGYSLAFGPDIGGWIGGLDWVGLKRSRSGPQSRLCCDDSPPGVHDLSDDVRDHYAGIDHGRIC